MKQHITKTQIEELTDEGRKSLKKWYYPKRQKGDLIFYEHPISPSLKDKVLIFGELPMQGDPTPLLSIGQMIEFLDEKAEINDFGYSRTDPYWKIEITNRSIGRGSAGHIDITPNIELCDALFEAVKEVLEK